MYRDTDRGIRDFVREGDTRVVSDRTTTKAKAMAIGTTIDPSYGYPLPMFGINYLDFEFGGRDSQLAMLFAGVLALGNVQRPKLLGSPLDGSVDFFAIAVPGSDKLYDAGGEREAERVLTWPLSAGANLGYQFTSFQKLSAQYQFRFDGYLHDRTTAEDYVTPASTTTHGIGAAYEYRRGGYSVVANGAWFGRVDWRPWGPADALVESPRTYTKYSVGVTKEYFLSVFSKVRVNARVVRRRAARSIQPVSVRPVRRDEGARRAGIGRALRRAGDAARVVLVQRLRAVSLRRLPRGRRRPRQGRQSPARPAARVDARSVAADHRYRRRLQPPRALEHDSPLGHWEEFSA